MTASIPRSYAVTGASSGLGAELARQLACRGDRLALIARRKDRLDAVGAAAREAAKAAGVAEPFAPLVLPADVTDRKALQEALEAAERGLPGGIDVLVLNAGLTDDRNPGHRFNPEVAAKVIEVNLTANAFAIASVLPAMLARRSGHIVGVSSLASYRGFPASASYCASKAGFSTLLEALRIDLKPYGIAVTTISPGFVKSEMTETNPYPMPFLLETGDGVARMIRGMDRRKREVRFPLPLSLTARVLRAMPDWLFEWVGVHAGRRYMGIATEPPPPRLGGPTPPA